ncbi:Na[+]-driven anion exchanger 1 [Strongyloides ratti]|uniref:Anion exchange protein n=1 Tax=Strongyloides ratti TaxID=34506 RepID=A0A090LF15_STRRB|nr:Na[+]-driven anion exchanger 1 [Strongyloides ratti]CEF68357.1 Na[+]-driven anion exchanger 1 [Strongyloides ratti]
MADKSDNSEEKPSETVLQPSIVELDPQGGCQNIWMNMECHGQKSTAAIRNRRLSMRHQSLDIDEAHDHLSPAAKIALILQENTALFPLFTEMSELKKIDGVEEWHESARWVKFEEDVEDGGNRWSKPHVATLSLHALFQLRSCIQNGVIILDDTATGFAELVENILDKLIEGEQLPEHLRLDVKTVLLKRHKHQYENPKKNNEEGGLKGNSSTFLSAVRSISDIGKSFSHARSLAKTGEPTINEDGTLGVPNDKKPPQVGNVHFMKKLHHDTEGCNVLVGETDFLQHHITCFVRLKKSVNFGSITEVPVPTRFLFLLLGPAGHATEFHEIGRAISTLMTDDIFHDVAYMARKNEDILHGIDEFLDNVCCLPPGEWDPKIRIEPPSSLPSQEKRKQAGMEYLQLPKSTVTKFKEVEEIEGHGNDPALKRTGKLCGGLVADIKRKLPHYISDFTDAFNLQCMATICFMYFALLAPIVTFGGLLEEATHQRMAAMENIFSGALSGVIYHFFSGQPLTIIGSTGPVLVFETIVFDLCKGTLGGINYLSFRFWVHIWTAAILMLMVVTDASSLVSYITRFTEESFATLIAAIFIFEAISKLFNITNQLDIVPYNPTNGTSGSCFCIGGDLSFEKIVHIAEKQRLTQYIDIARESVDWTKVPMEKCRTLGGHATGSNCYIMYDKFLMSVLLMAGTFILATTLKKARTGQYFPTKVRQIFSDFAVMIAIVIMTTVDIFAGINTPKLNVPSTFRPTWEGRNWFIPPFNGNPWWTVPVAFIPALLACILIFMDQQITTVIVNRKENKLKKGCGYHLDLFVLSILIILAGLLGLPIYVAATVLSINHVNSLRIESESRAPGEVAQFIGVREQRLTGICTFALIGMSVLITKLLSYIPMPVLYGVFLYMGISALGGIQLYERLKLFLMPMKYQPDAIYIRHVPIKVIHAFTGWQTACLMILWGVKSYKPISIAFPIMLVVMVGIRKLMEKFFDPKDLKYLDDTMPDFHLRRKEDARRVSLKAAEEIELDLDKNQGTIRAVKTEAHIHIPFNNGQVVSIPLKAISGPSHNINLSKEVNSSSMWKHISHESKSSLNKMSELYGGMSNDSMNKFPIVEDDDEDAIVIKVNKNENHNKNNENPSNLESQPLLRKGSKSSSNNK